MADSNELVTITPVTGNGACKPGEAIDFQFTVSNNSQDRALRIGAEVHSDEAVSRWFGVAGELERDLGPGATDTVVVRTAIPADTGAEGVTFHLRVYDARRPEEAATSPLVAVEVLREAESKPEDLPQKPDNKGFPWLIAGLAAGGVALLAGGLLTFLLWPDPSMPSLTGQNLEEALSALESKKLVAEVVEEVSGEAEPGVVIAQDPAADAQIPEDKTVQLVIEAVSVPVPGVVGMSVAEAQELLLAEGLSLGEIVEADAQTRGLRSKVLDQTPEEGQRALPGTAVSLTVEKQRIQVPSLVGQSLREATGTLERLGLLRGDVVHKRTGGTPGAVLSHTPVASEEVVAGRKVKLVIEAQRVPVPNLLGQNKSRALAMLRKLGLDPIVISRTTGRKPSGTVLSQHPRRGTELAAGESVRLEVERPRRQLGVKSVFLNTQIAELQSKKLYSLAGRLQRPTPNKPK